MGARQSSDKFLFLSVRYETLPAVSAAVLRSFRHPDAAGRRFLRVAVADGLVSLAVAGAFVAASPSERRPAVLAGMAGAALPDMDKPTKLWFGWSPFPAAVDRFHNRIQREAWHRGYIEILAAATLAPAALTALRGSAPRRLRRAGRAPAA
jgi:hypothetical protein